MFVNKELIAYLNGCEKGYKLFEKLYPNGAEVMEILDNKKIPKSIFHWGKENLNVSEEEIQKYLQVCKIINSTNVSFSEKVFDSNDVERSSNIVESNSVLKSQDVYNSSAVVNSDSITKSSGVSQSKQVTFSKNIISSNQIINSTNVIKSNSITRSNNIISSELATLCSFLLKCKKIINCHFSSFLVNCEYCFFCNGLNNSKKPMIFNTPISLDDYERIYDEYQELIKNEAARIVYYENISGEYIKDKCFVEGYCINDYREYFKYISDDFKKWIENLPYFDPFLMYQITYDENWLK